MNTLKRGRLNVGPIDATWGSSGKGKIADYIASKEELDFAISQNSFNACVTEGHVVYTDIGLTKIEDIVNGVATRILVADEWYDIIDRFDVGNRHILEIVISNGMTFRCTDGHKFNVWNGITKNMEWVQACEIDDTIHQFVMPKEFINIINNNYLVGYTPQLNIPNCTYMSNVPEYIDNNLAFIMGLMVGDGNYNKTNRCSLAVSHDQLENQSIFIDFLNKISINHDVRQIMDKRANVVTTSSAELQRFWRCIGIDAVCGVNKKVPHTIFKSPKSIIASFVAGIVESDGSIKGHGADGRITVVSNISENLVIEMQHLCTYLGFRTKLRSLDQTKRNALTGVNRQTQYELTICGFKSMSKFYDIIPLTTKKTALLNLLESKIGTPTLRYDSRIRMGDKTFNDSDVWLRDNDSDGIFSNNYFYDIDNVYDGGSDNVYDITVNDIHTYVCNGTLSHNSHITVLDDGTQHKFNALPSSVLNENVKIIMGADACVQLPQLLKEMRAWNLMPERLFIHPNMVIITDKQIKWEEENLGRIGSTMSGVGAAKGQKIMRHDDVVTADMIPELKPYIANTNEMVINWLKNGKTGLLETAQGFDLSLDLTFNDLNGDVSKFFPACTSRNINPAAFMGASFVPAQLIGSVFLNLRTYPIRVGDNSNANGNIILKFVDGSENSYADTDSIMLDDECVIYSAKEFASVADKFKGKTIKGKEFKCIIKLGSSGGCYPDQKEITWDDISRLTGVTTKEQTSLTKRIRRVFDKSVMQLQNSTMVCMPTHISINFVNYLDNNISGASGKTTMSDLAYECPAVYEYVKWVEKHQYWAGTEYEGKIWYLGTGPKRSDALILAD